MAAAPGGRVGLRRPRSATAGLQAPGRGPATPARLGTAGAGVARPAERCRRAAAHLRVPRAARRLPPERADGETRRPGPARPRRRSAASLLLPPPHARARRRRRHPAGARARPARPRSRGSAAAANQRARARAGLAPPLPPPPPARAPPPRLPPPNTSGGGGGEGALSAAPPRRAPARPGLPRSPHPPTRTAASGPPPAPPSQAAAGGTGRHGTGRPRSVSPADPPPPHPHAGQAAGLRTAAERAPTKWSRPGPAPRRGTRAAPAPVHRSAPLPAPVPAGGQRSGWRGSPPAPAGLGLPPAIVRRAPRAGPAPPPRSPRRPPAHRRAGPSPSAGLPCRAVRALPSLAEPRPPGSGAGCPRPGCPRRAPPLPDSRAPTRPPAAERRAPAPRPPVPPGRAATAAPRKRPAAGGGSVATSDAGRGLRRQPHGSGRRAAPPPHRHGWAGHGTSRRDTGVQGLYCWGSDARAALRTPRHVPIPPSQWGPAVIHLQPCGYWRREEQGSRGGTPSDALAICRVTSARATASACRKGPAPALLFRQRNREMASRPLPPAPARMCGAAGSVAGAAASGLCLRAAARGAGGCGRPTAGFALSPPPRHRAHPQPSPAPGARRGSAAGQAGSHGTARHCGLPLQAPVPAHRSHGAPTGTARCPPRPAGMRISGSRHGRAPPPRGCRRDRGPAPGAPARSPRER
ncbi:basic proline-rich protein-like [Motacilla alba alba]|uniref:basic proline-rich protein-like n=1 Tax=Motacilla alba alba TaxID=1094192 RepID=UPI0018D55BAB|nr:basic proline-rich protein-like [Motacilla alba alba]